MIEVIVFDLDDTLLDTSELLVPIAGTLAFERRIQQTLPMMKDAEENLRYLQDKYTLYLLTQGRVLFQRQKIASLGIEKYFQDCLVFEPTEILNKGHFFRALLQRSTIPAANHLSIGNRRRTDIREAKRAGYKTCFFAHGEHLSEVPEVPEDLSDFEVSNHQQLRNVCRL